MAGFLMKARVVIKRVRGKKTKADAGAIRSRAMPRQGAEVKNEIRNERPAGR
jgi:hypothetical protein